MKARKIAAVLCALAMLTGSASLYGCTPKKTADNGVSSVEDNEKDESNKDTTPEDEDLTEDETEQEEQNDFSSLNFEMKEEVFEEKADDGTLVYENKVTYPYFTDDTECAAVINDYIAERLEYINNNPDDADTFDYILEYQRDMLPFYHNLDVTVTYNTNGYVSMLFLAGDWTGGAHPYYYKGGKTYDIKTAEEKNYYDFFSVSKEQAGYYLSVRGMNENLPTANGPWYDECPFVLTENGLTFYAWAGDAVPAVEIVCSYDDPSVPTAHADVYELD